MQLTFDFVRQVGVNLWTAYAQLNVLFVLLLFILLIRLVNAEHICYCSLFIVFLSFD